MNNYISKEGIYKIFNNLKSKAIKECHNKSYSKSLRYIDSAARWMYNFNTQYSDTELDKTLKIISDNNLPHFDIRVPKQDKAVLIDNFGYDNRGLTQQYLRGLMKLNKQILYILHNNNPIRDSEIIRELNEYPDANVIIVKITNANLISSAQNIAQAISDFSPKDILLHIAPWDVVSLISIHSISGSLKYNINLTDHAFWLGSSFVNYNIEFRGYGEVLSIQKRGFKQNQLIRLPYYPITSKYTQFMGFPKLPENSVIVFCGGSEYKMLGKDDIFFKIMASILKISPNVHIIVAGINPGSTFEHKKNKLEYRERIHLIGNRKDINEVFAHSDIFLSSYPFIGGLMTQFAATNKIPILAYAEPNEVGTCDALINNFGKPFTTKRTLEDFCNYAVNLINNSSFRKTEGEKCYNSIMKENLFYLYLDKALKTHDTNILFEKEQPDYERMIGFYQDIEKTTHGALITLISQLRFESFIIANKSFLDIISMAIRHYLHKLRYVGRVNPC